MKTQDFWYELPPELIAQTPLQRRDGSRLMVMDRETGRTAHRHFYDIVDLLNPGDCLVMNDSRVLPARLMGHRPTGGVVEVLLLRDLGDNRWECLTKPGRKMQVGNTAVFGSGELTATVEEVRPDGNRVVRFDYEGIFLEVLEKLGRMPLPPYIKEELADQERYQTVYSRNPGSAAAPTAGLHFTQELLEKIREKGVNTAFVTLHVGLGTFRPVQVDEILDHHMHSELCMMNEETARLLNETKARGGRVICVGTTSCRTLESLVNEDGTFEAKSRWTDIFIYPGYRFKAMDGLITNFHLPESTLVMLVSAFSRREFVLNAYAEAVKERYRFFSFGDAMCILDGVLPKNFVDITGVRLETDRLILRPWEEKDLDDFYEYASVDGVGQMAGWAPHESIEMSRRILKIFMEGKDTFALELKENGKAIGSLGLHDRPEELPADYNELSGREIGYVLNRDYWGRGLMPEAVEAAIRYCFDTLHYDFVACGHFLSNHQSRRVIEKSGFTFLRELDYTTRIGTVERTALYVRKNDK